MASLADVLESIETLTKYLLGKLGGIKTISIAASGTTSKAADLGGNFQYLHIEIPTITSAQLSLQVSHAIGGTYQDYGESVLTQAGTGAYNDTWKLGGWRYIKIKSSDAQISTVIFKLRGITY